MRTPMRPFAGADFPATRIGRGRILAGPLTCAAKADGCPLSSLPPPARLNAFAGRSSVRARSVEYLRQPWSLRRPTAPAMCRPTAEPSAPTSTAASISFSTSRDQRRVESTIGRASCADLAAPRPLPARRDRTRARLPRRADCSTRAPLALMLASHYHRTPLPAQPRDVRDGERCLPSAQIFRYRARVTCRPGHLVRSAANLFSHLRALDARVRAACRHADPDEDLSKLSTTGCPARAALILSVP